MFDSFATVGVALIIAMALIAFFLLRLKPKPMFDNRQAVQNAVEDSFNRRDGQQPDVAWCAAGENGLFGVFELRDGRFGIVHGRSSGALVQRLHEGDIKKMVQSKDGFGLFVTLTDVFKPKVKLVFDDIAAATYARNLIAKALPRRS